MGSSNSLNNILLKAIEHLPIGVFWKNTDGRYLGCNKYYLNIVGLESEKSIIGTTDRDLTTHFRDACTAEDRLQQTDHQVLNQGESIIAEPVTIQNAQGRIQFEITKIPLKSYADNIVGLLGIAIDVSSKYNSEQKLQDKTALLNSIFDAIPDFVIYKDLQGNIVECNRAVMKLAKQPKSEIVGRSIDAILPAGSARVSEEYDSQLRSDKSSANYKLEFELDGREIYVDVNKHPVIKNNKLVGTVSISRDLKERRINQQKIDTLTKFDHLTQLLNRPTFLQSLKNLNRHAEWGMLLIDIKKFGSLNNLHGSDIGDLTLLHIAETLKLHAPDDAIIARVQGDRFAVLSQAISDSRKLRELCQNIALNLNKKTKINNHLIDLAICIGAANYPNCGQQLDQLLHCSEQALLRTRQNLQQNYTLFDPILEAKAEAEMLLVDDLKLAIAEKNIDLYFQPIVDANNSKVLGAEALARWHHPVHGLVMPMRFIELAEKNNLIGELGEVVIEKACRQVAQWQAIGLDLFIAVNLSPIQFNDPLLISKIKSYIDYYQIPANSLEIEVTESALMESNLYVEQMLEELIGLGIRLSIDDFGTGYCSLSYLKKMPAHKLKIDRSFVDDLELDKTTTAITRSVISLARELNITVTAEGVEDAAQMAWLQQQNCDQFQGYLFSKPLPSKQFYQWYLQHNENIINTTPPEPYLVSI